MSVREGYSCGWLRNPFHTTFLKPWNDSILQHRYQETLWFQPWFQSGAGFPPSTVGVVFKSVWLNQMALAAGWDLFHIPVLFVSKQTNPDQELCSYPGDSFSMNFLVVLVFSLLFPNLDAFFEKSPKTTKTSIYVREISELIRFFVFPAHNYPQNARKRPQNPSNARKAEQDVFWVRGSPKIPRNHLERPTRPKLPGNQNA